MDQRERWARASRRFGGAGGRWRVLLAVVAVSVVSVVPAGWDRSGATFAGTTSNPGSSVVAAADFSVGSLHTNTSPVQIPGFIARPLSTGSEALAMFGIR